MMLKERAAAVAKKIHTLEVDVKAAEENIEKTKNFQRQAKSNKEYQILKEKMEEDKKKADAIEEQILELMEEQEKIARETAAAKEDLARAGKAHADTTRQVNARTKELEAQLAGLREKRKEAAAKIDPEDLAIYERSRRQAKGTSALAPVRGNICGACNEVLPPQVINLAHIGKDLVTCVSCRRVLYTDDESLPKKEG